MIRTMEPVLPKHHVSPHHDVPAEPIRKKLQLSRPLYITVAAVAILTIGVIVILLTQSTPNYIPAAIRQQVGFPLYQPEHLPKGYVVDTNSFNVTQQVATFTVTYQNSKQLVFSEQAKPAELDFVNFYSQQLADAQAFTTAIGQAAVGIYQGVGLATVSAGNTWILVRAPEGIATDQFAQIVRNLR